MPLLPVMLLAAVFALLIFGFLRYPYDEDRMGRMPKLTELPQSALLIAFAALIWQRDAQGTPLADLALLVTLGITFGFLGDLFMANVFGQENSVLYGMGAFALGHVCYMAGFRQIAVAFGLHQIGSYIIAMIALWLLAFALWWLLIRSPEGESVMQYAALGYALFLASMAAYAVGLALHEPTFWPLALGGGLFLFSDALIAARLFAGRRFRYLGDVIWGTYILAQVLIVTAVPAALALMVGF